MPAPSGETCQGGLDRVYAQAVDDLERDVTAWHALGSELSENRLTHNTVASPSGRRAGDEEYDICNIVSPHPPLRGGLSRRERQKTQAHARCRMHFAKSFFA